MAQELKGIPVVPLTGVLDARSSTDLMPSGSLRMRQNLRVDGEGKLRRGNGWQKLLSRTDYTNQDLHDQLLALSGVGIRQPLTLVQELTSTRRVRSLLAATQSAVFHLNEHTGNWRVLGSGFGGSPSPSAAAPRFYCAQLGDYVLLTNDYDKPQWHVLEQSAVNTPNPLNTFNDFETIGLRRAAVVWVWHNCAFFADVEMDGERQSYRVLWSDFNSPLSFDPASVSSIAGSKDLFRHERILAGKPGLGNTFLIYTTHGIWEMTVVGGEQSFAFRRIYNGEDNEGVALLKYRNTLVEFSDGHLYGAEDGIYVFNQYAGRPERVEWIHRASSLVYNGINNAACSVHVAKHANNEVLFSVANADAVNECPNVTLRIHLKYKVADFVDAGFTAIDTYRSYDVPTIRDFIVDNGICDLAGLAARGYTYGQEALPNPLPESTAPFAPQSFYSSTPQTIATGDSLAAAKTPVEYGRAANVATLKVVGHGYTTGNTVLVAGIPDPSFNTPGSVITVTDADHFTYGSTGSDLSTTAVGTPRVRLLSAPREATALVLVNGTVSVHMTGHGYVNGQHLRIAAREFGNPLLNASEVAITVIDANNFTYATTATTAATVFGAPNIANLMPNGKAYIWTDYGSQEFTGPLALQAGNVYLYGEGTNEINLHLTGPNTDLAANGWFTYDGAGFTLYGRQRLSWVEKFDYVDTTSHPPNTSEIRMDNTDPEAVTHIYVDNSNHDAADVSSETQSLKTGDILSVKVAITIDPTPQIVFYRINSVTKHNTWVEYQVSHTLSSNFDGPWTTGTTLLLAAFPASQPADNITATFSTGLKVMVMSFGNAVTPVSVSRNDPDNPDVVRMELTAHGFVSGNILLIDGMSDATFNSAGAKVEIVQNTTHPEYSVSDANHFTYRRPGNVVDPTSDLVTPAARLVTQVAVVTEDWAQANADGNSLCALLDGLKLDDICRRCEGQTLVIAASSQDLCLKQMTNVFYRERCANPSAVGAVGDNGYVSSVGSYALDGYDSVFRFAPIFVTQPGQPLVTCTEFKLFYSDAALQTTPNTFGLRVGISSQPRDPNVDSCGIVWHQHSQQPVKCMTGRTESEHKLANTQPAEYCHWNFYRRARYLYLELRMTGTGGDAVFNSVVADAGSEQANNF